MELRFIILSIILIFGILSESFQICAYNANEVYESDSIRHVTNLQELKVSGLSFRHGNRFVSTPQQASSTISIMGEPDILRHISSNPGVSQGMEGSLGMFVRGGSNSSNRLMFNEVPVYASSHLMGLVSTFSPDIISDAVFTMGGISADKGNLSSSLLDVNVKHHYEDSLRGSFSLSPYLSGLYSSIPVLRNKMSIQVAGRLSVAPYLARNFLRNTLSMGIDANDVTVLMDYKIKKWLVLNAMYNFVNDNFSYSSYWASSSLESRSKSWRLSLYSQINDKIRLDGSYYSTHFETNQKLENFNHLNDSIKFKSGLLLGTNLMEQSAKLKLNYNLRDIFNLIGGVDYTCQDFVPIKSIEMTNVDTVNNLTIERNRLLSVYLESHYKYSDFFDLSLGYRQTFQRLRNNSDMNYDFHALTHFCFSSNLGVEMSFDRNTQFYHVLEGLPLGWTMNIMFPSSTEYPLEVTQQYYGGVFWRLTNDNVMLNVTGGGYYKSMNNLLVYRNSKNSYMLDSSQWEDLVYLGKGRSIGAELSVSLGFGRFEGTMAYTLSKTDRKFPKINKGKWFPFKFDRRNILNMQGKYLLSRSVLRHGVTTEHSVNGVLAYTTGNLATITIGHYEGLAPPYWNHVSGGLMHPDDFFDQIYDRQQMSSVNGYRMKDYFRIDMGYTYKRIGKRFINELALSVFNILNRHNPYMYFQEKGEWKQLSLVPIMPSVRWSLHW